MNRWKEAQRAELAYYDRGPSDRPFGDTSPEFRLLGIDPTTVHGTVVDIGGAYGSFLVPFTNAERRVVVDPLYDSLGRRLPGIEGISDVGERLPFADHSVDFVLLRNVIDHMLMPESLVIEAARIVRPDGRVYFMVNTFPVVMRPLFPLMNRLDRPHPVHLTNDDVRLMLRKHFEIVRERVSGSGHPSLKLRRLAGWLIKREYYCVLRTRGLTPSAAS